MYKNFNLSIYVFSFNVNHVGMAAGAFLFGTISDVAGRKKLIPITLGIVFCASAALAFAQANFFINLSVFMLGLG